MIYDRIENSGLYLSHPAWKKAFDFVKKLAAGAECKKHEIDGENVFAIVSEYETRLEKDALFETHRKYTDVQILLAGSEKIGFAPLSEISPEGDFDEAKDAALHPKQSPKTGGSVTLVPGVFAVFFPGDAHMPGLRAGKEAAKVKKVVLKIKSAVFKA
jgi:YhcH/YjgK/YiaL family protein